MKPIKADRILVIQNVFGYMFDGSPGDAQQLDLLNKPDAAAVHIASGKQLVGTLGGFYLGLQGAALFHEKVGSAIYIDVGCHVAPYLEGDRRVIGG